MCFRPPEMSLNKKCPECGHMNLSLALNCKKCGAELPAAEPDGAAPAPGAPGAPAAPAVPGAPKAPGAPVPPAPKA